MAQNLMQGNHKLGSSEEAREAIASAKEDDLLTVDRSGKLLRFLDAGGRLFGTLTARHEVTKRLEAGEPLLHCCVAWTYPASDRYPFGLASARVITGDPKDPANQWYAREIWGKPREPRPEQSYPVNVVGESNFQDAIRTCRGGDAVALYRETDNPHDARAVVVKTSAGATIGYIPRDSWLQRVVHDDGCGATAAIKAVYRKPRAAVVLDVMVSADPLELVPYAPR